MTQDQEHRTYRGGEPSNWSRAPGLVAVPCQEVVWTPSFVALHRVVLRAPKGSRESFNYDPYPVHLKRNWCGRQLLEEENGDLRWILMVDSDMLPPEDTIERLLPALEGFDIVGGLCFARRPPHPVCAGTRDSNGEQHYLDLSQATGPVTEVEWVGTGCVMIKREVFEQLLQPWFRPNLDGRGEDVNFMLKAQAEGFRIGCAVDLSVGHLALVNVDREYVEHWAASFSEEDGDRRARMLWSVVRPI